MSDSITRNLFISYAREDRPIAETLHAYLKPLIAQGKLRVFIDTEEIKKGEEWHKKITGQLHHADAFLFLVSQHYFRSKYVIETELPAMIKRYRDEQAECWPFLVSDYPWDDFVIDGFNLAGIQAIGPFDDNKRLTPLNALPAPDQDSQFRSVYTEVRDWIEKLELEEQQKQEALARQQEQKELEEKNRMKQEEEQRKESERKRREQEEQPSAGKPEARQTDAHISDLSPVKSGSAKVTPAFRFKYLWLVFIGLVAVVFIYQWVENMKQMRQVELDIAVEQTKWEMHRKAREEAEAVDRPGVGEERKARAAAEAKSQRKSKRVEELLPNGAVQLDDGFTYFPLGDVALESIRRQAREIQPDSARASEILEAILDRYLELAQSAMEKNEFDKAQQFLDYARRVDTDSSRLADAQKKLDAARGLAATASSQLELRSFRDTLSSGGKGPEMVLIPAGSFMMGSPDLEAGRYSNEGPQHKVQIRSFALGKTEVTFDEYGRFVEATGHELPDDSNWGRGDRPVINVSWEDATAYGAWLSQQTGKHYRLPSEAEWEYAARAGTVTERYWPNPTEGEIDPACNYANVFDSKNESRIKEGRNINWEPFECGDDYPFSAPVGQFTPNDWQLHDILGNVWEWVQDCHVDSYEGAPGDGTPREVTETCEYRVLRGGSWGNEPRLVRSATHFMSAPDRRNVTIGFRLARTK